MNYTENRTRAGEYLRLALGHMAKYNLPATPVNYTIFYEYAAGKNLKLRNAVEAAFKSAAPLNPERMEKFYTKFVADGDRLVVSRLLTKINFMLRDISRHLVETEGDLAGHGSNLEQLGEKVKEVTGYEDLKAIVDQMILETRELIQSGSRLQNRMQISSEDLHQLNRELEDAQKEAQTDALTGLINRRGLTRAFEVERTRAGQSRKAFSVIMLDLDHFKKVNDTYGHLVGDSLLRGISQIMKIHLRGSDIAARYGGEEFLVILPETELAGAQVVAGKIQKSLASKEWKVKESGKSMGVVTASMGIAVYAGNESPEDLIKRADQALYMAKKTGRNKIITQEALVN
ncbi:GGDEF domain-containing protein [Desulfospira joergensenii]|uniref:GGDEF domain-containing protein n=1 Tax=Desulfospira joergensenii TaxID=53329 RepID=UPI0003B4E20C|nr:GGDEF domain-containing protein [Desulfospira joergensenii]